MPSCVQPKGGFNSRFMHQDSQAESTWVECLCRILIYIYFYTQFSVTNNGVRTSGDRIGEIELGHTPLSNFEGKLTY